MKRKAAAVNAGVSDASDESRKARIWKDEGTPEDARYVLDAWEELAEMFELNHEHLRLYSKLNKMLGAAHTLDEYRQASQYGHTILEQMVREGEAQLQSWKKP
jgi:hypothetical protein